MCRSNYGKTQCMKDFISINNFNSKPVVNQTQPGLPTDKKEQIISKKAVIATASSLALLAAAGIYIARRGKTPKPPEIKLPQNEGMKPTAEAEKIIKDIKTRLGIKPEISDKTINNIQNGRVKPESEVWASDDMKKYYESLDIPSWKNNVLDKNSATLTLQNRQLITKDGKGYTGDIDLGNNIFARYENGHLVEASKYNGNKLISKKVYQDGKILTKDKYYYKKNEIYKTKTETYTKSSNGSRVKTIKSSDDAPDEAITFVTRKTPEGVKVTKYYDNENISILGQNVLYTKEGKQTNFYYNDGSKKVILRNKKGELKDRYEINTAGTKIDLRPRTVSYYSQDGKLKYLVKSEEPGQECLSVLKEDGKTVDFKYYIDQEFGKRNNAQGIFIDLPGFHKPVCFMGEKGNRVLYLNDYGTYFSAQNIDNKKINIEGPGQHGIIFDVEKNDFAEGSRKYDYLKETAQKLFGNNNVKSVDELYEAKTKLLNEALNELNNPNIKKVETINCV